MKSAVHVGQWAQARILNFQGIANDYGMGAVNQCIPDSADKSCGSVKNRP